MVLQRSVVRVLTETLAIRLYKVHLLTYIYLKHLAALISSAKVFSGISLGYRVEAALNFFCNAEQFFFESHVFTVISSLTACFPSGIYQLPYTLYYTTENEFYEETTNKSSLTLQQCMGTVSGGRSRAAAFSPAAEAR